MINGGNAEKEGRERSESMLLTEDCREQGFENVLLAEGVLAVVTHGVEPLPTEVGLVSVDIIDEDADCGQEDGGDVAEAIEGEVTKLEIG
jgi:hypothetical protein